MKVGHKKFLDFEFTLDTINEAAIRFWDHFDTQKVFALHGEMGSGKTTFVHALCAVRNVEVTASSPTFSIINEYPMAAGKIYHMDLYRLRDEIEVIQAGVEECFYTGATCFIEWPEKAASLLPDTTVHIIITITDNHTRRIRETDK
ncbi:MAG TPA: tRNA (adenosine(37)-N6)-threonylcarbamoyltransferase complex ATPase subunit type 1 TsaE [Flavitalea sp.]|nr:tRNA (adenosine(37)-N6)-threonylcarbamoyltransferase complex ATPase subunit type 1 TsaE [Flavitalea sp.]